MGSLSADWSGFLVLAEVCCQEEERLMGMKLLAQKDSVWGSIPKRKRSCSSVPAKIASGFPVLESRALNLISSSGFADKESDVIATGFCEKGGSRIVGNEGLKRESCVDGVDDIDWEAKRYNWSLLPGLVGQESKRLAIVVSGSLEQQSRKNHNVGLKRKSCVCGPDDDKDRAKRKKRKYGTRVKGLCHAPPANLPEKYMTMVNGAEVKLVIQKQLYATDVKRHQGRLTLPPGKLVCKDFLRANEMEILNQGSLTVPMIDPKLDKEEISLCLWKLTDSDERKSLVLKTTWNKIVEKNNLIEGDLIQIWSSRDDNDLLQLALVVVKKVEKGKSGEEAGIAVQQVL